MSLNFIPGSSTTKDALSAQKMRLDLISQNIANAYTTKDIDGQPYQRKIATFESYLNDENQKGASSLEQSVRVSDVKDDTTPGEFIYNPHHPHANTEGFVAMPNVSIAKEMVDMIDTSAQIKANLAALKTSKEYAIDILSIGK